LLQHPDINAIILKGRYPDGSVGIGRGAEADLGDNVDVKHKNLCDEIEAQLKSRRDDYVVSML